MINYRQSLFALLVAASLGCQPATEMKHPVQASPAQASPAQDPPAQDPPAQAPPVQGPSADSAPERPAESEQAAAGGTAESSVGSPSEIALVQADARRLQNAFVDGDSATFVELTYPPAVEELGGAEKAKAVMDEIMAKLKAEGMAIQSLKFPEAPTFFSSATQDFVYVPMLSIFAVKDQRIESLSFLLGVKPRDASKWTYVDGAQVDADIPETWLPALPPGHPVPKTYKRKL